MRTAIDEIPDTPQPIFVGVKSHFVQQRLEWRETPLDIPNNVCRHVELINR